MAITDNLIVYNPLNGNVLDLSGHGYNGTATGSPGYDIGRLGTAIDFTNAATMYYTLPAGMTGVDNVQVLVIDLWFRITTATAFTMLFSHGTGVNARLEGYLDTAGTGLEFTVTTASGVLLTGRAAGCCPSTGTYYHATFILNLAGSTSAQRMQIRLNNVDQTLSFTVGGSGPPTATPNLAASVFGVGRRFYAGNLGFPGRIDEFRMYSVLPSEADFATLNLTTGPVIDYAFTTDTGTTITDYSGFVNHGSASSAGTYAAGKYTIDAANEAIGSTLTLPAPWTMIWNGVTSSNYDDGVIFGSDGDATSVLTDTGNVVAGLDGATIVGGAVLTGATYNLALTFDGTNFTFWKNGVSQGSATASGGVTLSSIGSLVDAGNITFDRIRVWPRKLTDLEVATEAPSVGIPSLYADLYLYGDTALYE